MANQLKQLIENHGFTAFINANGKSVSFWIGDSVGDYILVTVDSILSAQIAMGY